MPVTAFRKQWVAVALAVGLASALEPGRAYWLHACDKRDVAGRVLVPGTRDWEDAPVRPDLVEGLRASGWTVRSTLRWTNLISAAPSIATSPIPACLDLGGTVARAVRSPEPVAPVAARGVSVDPAPVTLRRMHDAMGVTAMQEALAQTGRRPGGGMRVAIIDDGFVLQHKALQDASVLDAWDYVSDDSVPWDEGPAPWAWDHGTATASLIASSWVVTLPGIAPYADLLLYRTEDDDHETLVEEDHLAAAIERATVHGARVISISLGYRYLFDGGLPDHPYDSLDGKTLVASVTAAKAAGRDVVVVAAMGNEGSYGSRSLGSPADADSILAVGAIAENGLLCGFSSTGPAADGRIKPELVAYGCSVPVATGQGPEGFYEGGAGTSYATPLVAGAALLLRQYQPAWSAMTVRRALLRSGSRSGSPDTLQGWGLPDLRKLLSNSSTRLVSTVWQASRGVLRFRIGTEPSKPYEFEFRSLDGSLLHRGRRAAGEGTLWDGAPPPGTYIASWIVEGRRSSSLVVVTDR